MKNSLLKFVFLMLACSTQLPAFDDMNSQDGGFKIYGQYLYWNVVQDQMQYAARLPGGVQGIIAQIDAGDDDIVTIAQSLSIVEPSSDYKSGFRIGLGYQVPCSNWDFSAAWTSLHAKRNSSISDPDAGIIPLANPVTSLFGFVDREPSMFGFGDQSISRWKYEFDTVDIEIGRVCTLSPCLKMRPFVGIKLASIRQSQHVEFIGFEIDEDPTFINTSKKNNFRGVGPSFGFEASWEFFEGFSLNSKLCGALLYGNIDSNIVPMVTFPPNMISIVVKTNKKHRLKPTVDASIGLGWNSLICESYPIQIGLAYEAQYWWNQWQSPQSVVTTITANAPQGDLVLYGLTVQAAIGF